MASLELHIPQGLLDELVAHAEAELPHECCGLLAGRGNTASHRFALVNDRASGVEYLSEPRSMLRANREINRLGLDLLAVYHSHPTSDPIPSRTDLAENHFGESVVHVIVGLVGGRAEVRAWRLGPDQFTPVTVTVVG